MRHLWVCLAAAGAVALAGHAALGQALGHLTVGAIAPDFSLQGADGHRHQLSDYRGKVVVLNWTSPVCPFTAHQYDTHAMQKLQRQAASQGAVWLAINTSKPGRPGFLTPVQAKARLGKLKAHVTAFLFDDGAVGRLYGARDTPTIYVIGKDGRLDYQGAFDDDSAGTGVVHHVYGAEALSDLKAGKPIKVAETRQVGCPVEY